MKFCLSSNFVRPPYMNSHDRMLDIELFNCGIQHLFQMRLWSQQILRNCATQHATGSPYNLEILFSKVASGKKGGLCVYTINNRQFNDLCRLFSWPFWTWWTVSIYACLTERQKHILEALLIVPSSFKLQNKSSLSPIGNKEAINNNEFDIHTRTLHLEYISTCLP